VTGIEPAPPAWKTCHYPSAAACWCTCMRPAALVSGPGMPGVTASLHVGPGDRARNGHGHLALMRVDHLVVSPHGSGTSRLKLSRAAADERVTAVMVRGCPPWLLSSVVVKPLDPRRGEYGRKTFSVLPRVSRGQRSCVDVDWQSASVIRAGPGLDKGANP
jgi:hypothetical protein